MSQEALYFERSSRIFFPGDKIDGMMFRIISPPYGVIRGQDSVEGETFKNFTIIEFPFEYSHFSVFRIGNSEAERHSGRHFPDILLRFFECIACFCDIAHCDEDWHAGFSV